MATLPASVQGCAGCGLDLRSQGTEPGSGRFGWRWFERRFSEGSENNKDRRQFGGVKHGKIEDLGCNWRTKSEGGFSTVLDTSS